MTRARPFMREKHIAGFPQCSICRNRRGCANRCELFGRGDRICCCRTLRAQRRAIGGAGSPQINGQHSPLAAVPALVREKTRSACFRRANWKSPAATRQVTKPKRSLKGCVLATTPCACILGAFIASLVCISTPNAHRGSAHTMGNKASIIQLHRPRGRMDRKKESGFLVPPSI